MDEIKIGAVIQRTLRERRQTLKELSREAGLPYSTLHTWQENRQPKDILKAKKLAEFLKISLHELLFDRPDPREPTRNSRIDSHALDLFGGGRFEIHVKRMG